MKPFSFLLACLIAVACRSTDAPREKDTAGAGARPTAAWDADLARPHDFGVLDMLSMQRLSEPAVSPDGRTIAFSVRSTDFENNRGRTDVWSVDVDGRNLRRIAGFPENDSSPRFAPDGKSILFLSSMGGSSQVWRSGLDGKAAWQVTDLPLDVNGFAVLPDGERLLLALEVYPELGALEETAELDRQLAASPVQARLYDSLLFRHWDSWEDHKKSHLFVWSPKETPLDLMRGMHSDSPTRPFGGMEEVDVSPDGREVVFAAKAASPDAAWNTNVDIWSVPVDGSAPPKRLSADNKAYDNAPCFSPDGKWLAWLAMERAGYEADRQRIVLLERASGTQRVLAPEWDRSPGGLTWGRASDRLYATADDVGQHALFAIDTRSGSVQRLVARGTSASPVAVERGVAFLHDTLRAPAELFLLPEESDVPRALTGFNAARVSQARMGDYEQFQFTGAQGDAVHGYLVKPANFDPSRRYPVAFLIHGGPQGSFGDRFHYRWNPQAYAGAGFAAIMIDFHGSTGYGQAFTDAIRGDWGGAPYQDLMLGLDHALATYPFLDGSRVAALGASYGGYMINWIAGQTERFRCLVNHDGNLDERMAYYDTEELWFPEWEHGGPPWEAGSTYAKHNPIDHVGRWKTPMLVIHGAKDYRVVDTQGLSTFTALQRRGIPSRLLYFPDENHWVLKPQNSKLWHDTVLAWIKEWTK